MLELLEDSFGTLNNAVTTLGLARANTYRHMNLDVAATKDQRTAEVPLSFYMDVWRRLRAYDSERFPSGNAFWEAVEQFTAED